MNNRHRLSVEIGAALSSGWQSAFRGASTQVSQLGSTIRGLEAQSNRLTRFDELRQRTTQTQAAWRTAQRTLARLNREVAETEQPTRAQTQALTRAERVATAARRAWERSSDALQAHRRQMDQAGESTRDLVRQQERLGSAMERLRARQQALGSTQQAIQNNRDRRSGFHGQVMDTVALGASIAAPVKTAIDFEQSIAKLGAITQADAEAKKAMESNARKLGETTAFTASEAASAMTFLGMAGLKTNEILAATPGMLDLATAAGSDLGGTADIASNILSGFSLKAGEMGRVGDVLAATFTSSNTTLEMLGETMKYAAPVASAVGASLEEVAAMAGLMGNVGIQGSMGGTALRAAFLRLAGPPKMAQNAIMDLGKSADEATLEMEASAAALGELGLQMEDEATGKMRPLPDLLKDIAVATQEMSDMERLDITKRIFGTEASAGMIELLKQAGSGELDRYIGKIKASQGHAAKMAKEMSATTHGALKRLGSALESVAISLGSVLLPAVAKAAETFAGYAGKMSTFAQEHPLLTKGIMQVVGGLIGFKVAAMAVGYAWTFVRGAFLSGLSIWQRTSAALVSFATRAIPMIITGFRALGVAMMTNPVGLVVGGLALAAGLIIANWDKVKSFFSTIWEPIRPYWETFANWVGDIWEKISSPFEALTSLGDTISGWWGSDEQPVQLGKTIRTTTAAAGMMITPVAVAQADVGPVSTTPTAMVQPADSTALTTASTQVNATIHVHAVPGQDAKEIAQQVMRELEQLQDQQRRGALHD